MSHYFLCSQNKHSKNRRFFQCMVSDFVAAEFPKTPSPKPARIHSPDPFLRAGKFSRGFAKSFSPENSFGKTESALFPFHSLGFSAKWVLTFSNKHHHSEFVKEVASRGSAPLPRFSH